MLRWALIAVMCPAMLYLIRIRPTPLHYWGAAFFVWAMASLLWSPVLDDALQEWTQFLFMAMAFVIAAEQENNVPLYRGLAIGMIFSFAVVLLQLGGLNPVVMAKGDVASTGLFVNSNILGWTAAPLLIVLLAQRCWIDYVLSIPVGFCLIMSDCRSAIGAAFICFIGLAWQRSRWVGGAIAVVAAAFVFHRIHRFDDAASLVQREDIWRDTVKGITPLGHGIGSFYSMYLAYSTGLTPQGFWVDLSHAHNDALEMFFELGLPGLILASIFIVLVLRYCGRAERYGLACLGMVGMVGFPLHQPVTQVLVAAMAGNAARDWRCLRDNQSSGYISVRYRHRYANHAAAIECGSPIPA